MLSFGKKETMAELRENAKGEHEFPDDNLTVYTTPYGTQYVLPIDLLLTHAEMLGFLDEVRTKYLEEQNGEQGATPTD